MSSPRTTVVAVASFLDAFQKVADLATSSRGKQLPLTVGCVCAGVCVRVCVSDHVHVCLCMCE